MGIVIDIWVFRAAGQIERSLRTGGQIDRSGERCRGNRGVVLPDNGDRQGLDSFFEIAILIEKDAISSLRARVSLVEFDGTAAQ